MIETDTQLGKFRIIRQIGKGGMADVFLAEDPQLGRTVAIKVLPPQLALGEDWVARFNREVRATANLFHPNIVTVYDVGEQSGIHFYAMEYLPNGDLKQRIEQGISVLQSLVYLKQIAKALRYAHNKGFIHRDIKPENILFDEDDNAKLTDLGIAKALNKNTQVTDAGVSIGTPRYISPEQAQNDSLDGRSDIYSLGVVFYEMLTGEVPYDSDDPITTALAHINGPVPRLPPQFALYQQFLEAMMAKTKDDRFSDADDLIEAIELLENDHPFTLEDYYEKRRSRQSDILNFEGISESLDARPKTTRWLLTGLFISLVALGFYEKDWVFDTIDKTYRQAAATFAENTADDNDPSGVIQIGSNPEGATVYLNGVKMGQTPYLGQSIVAGKHELTLTHPLFRDLKDTIEIEKDSILQKQFTLQPGIGDLQINSSPMGASIVLNGKALNATTPHRLEQLASGKHQLFLFKNHLAVEREVYISHGKEQTIKPVLKPGLMAYYPDQWVRVDQLYQTAQLLTQQKQWSSPAGNNAEEAYHAILKVDSTQKRALQNLKALGYLHWEAAKQAAENGDLATTEKHLSHSRRLLKKEYSQADAQKITRLAAGQ